MGSCTLVLNGFLWLGLSCRDQSDEIRVAVDVHHDQYLPAAIGPDCDPALLVMVVVFDGEGDGVVQDSFGISQANSVFGEVSCGFCCVELNSEFYYAYIICMLEEAFVPEQITEADQG